MKTRLQTNAMRFASPSALLRELADHERVLREVASSLFVEAGTRAPDPAASQGRGSWLLDNYSFVQSQVRETREALRSRNFQRLPAGTKALRKGIGTPENRPPAPRIYALVLQALDETGPAFDFEGLVKFLRASPYSQDLLLVELWAVGALVKLALVARVRRVAEEQDDERARPAILALRAADNASWRDLVESVSCVETTLRGDPAGAYARMDFDSREYYRRTLAGIASHARLSELEIARIVFELSPRAAEESGVASRTAHVGYYLIGPGAEALKGRAGYRPALSLRLRDCVYRKPELVYPGIILAVTLALTALACFAVKPVPYWLPLILLIPVSQIAVALVNSLFNAVLPPRKIPRLDFSSGIPADCRTFVVVPTLLLSRAIVDKLLERVEIHYLANRDPNLYFALLTDFPDSARATADGDYLLDYCAKGIRLLNERYKDEGAPFYLFHRSREWSKSESAWIGWERKRGKLIDFNRLLLKEADGFSRKVGDLSVLRGIRYVITLDSDTQLPRDTASKLIGAMAHPLNRPMIDPAANAVREGYSILQPRVSISMESASRSRLARFYGVHAGLDPYATAVSDVYQDLCGQASFTGKGIYDVEAFERVLGERFPPETLLSHDLIEGEYGRTGLVTDLEFVDDYPGTYQAYSARKHRWVRGDWQIARWLGSRVPNASGRLEANTLSLLSRWKILDNLRRSLVEICLFILLIAGWFSFSGGPLRWTLLAAALLAAPAYAELAWSAARVPPRRFWRSYAREKASRFAWGHVDALLGLMFLANQACLMADAIARTIFRMTVTHQHLLEWQSMAQSEDRSTRRRGIAEICLFLPPALALLIGLLLPAERLSYATAVVILELWIVTPLLAHWLNRPPALFRRGPDDTPFLRDTALRTWRFFLEHSGPEQNWLIPDNVQEDPPNVDGRASPTNIGLLLNASLAALDFGYITAREFIGRNGKSLGTMQSMERWRGHFCNWYDTHTLAALEPRYVSSVDSGNLAASLLVVKQGCIELANAPVISTNSLAGLRDHAMRLLAVLPPSARSGTIVRSISSLARQLEYHPTDLFFWEGVLSEASAMIHRLREPLDAARSKLGGPQSQEIAYWYGALVERAGRVVADLYSLAPWLASPFETELRSSASHPALRELLAELDRVLPLSEMPKRYEEIREHLDGILASNGSLKPRTAVLLRQLRNELPAARARSMELIEALEGQAEIAGALVDEMDFSVLFNSSRKLLSIGYNVSAGQLDRSCYDLLASEARTAVFLAIAKGDIARETWFRLGRRTADCQGSRMLLSWSGTMFEYLMPSLFMRTYGGTLLGDSARNVVRIQQAHAKARGVPWGISESAYAARDEARNYHYQAFGVAETALRRDSGADLVIAPYAAMLALGVDRPAAAANLRAMNMKGWTGRYGFYEAADYTRGRVAPHQQFTLVRTYMAHHQGMSLLALDNAVLGNPMQARFHGDPLVQSTEFLLEERVPVLLSADSDEFVFTSARKRTAVAADSRLKRQPDTLAS